MLIDATFKGFPPQLPPLDREGVARQGWRLLDGDLPLPLAVLRRSALQHNLAWMRDFCAARGLSLAPHGKTTMSPELWDLQLAHGAWGLSLATVWQARQALQHGVRRVILANQVLQAAELDALAVALDDSGARVMFLVDAEAQVQLIEAWRQRRSWPGRFEVLLELGIDGQRTGVREADAALRLARRVATSPALQLVGIECYEGGLASCNEARDRPAVQALMDRVEALARACVTEGLFAHEEIILSAGGSSIFDLVAERLQPSLGRSVRGVLRSGCYLTHDHLHYHRHLLCVGQRLQLSQTLQPALEVLAAVQSCPEPGLALLSMGKRDVSYDWDLPVPIWRAELGARQTEGVPGHWEIRALNDQHAHLRYDPGAPAADWPRLGETVACGISHPCTTFDKWRWMPVVDEDYVVIDAITTRF